ncbi:MAG: hypothetical protein ACREH8_17875, partial [Opitutaceae bacterium]
MPDYSTVETNMFVLTPELSQEVAESAEPGNQNSAASASSCKNGFVLWLFAIGEPLVPGAIREKGRATIPKSIVLLRAFSGGEFGELLSVSLGGGEQRGDDGATLLGDNNSDEFLAPVQSDHAPAATRVVDSRGWRAGVGSYRRVDSDTAVPAHRGCAGRLRAIRVPALFSGCGRAALGLRLAHISNATNDILAPGAS